jgi:hypothetical protein
MTGQRVDPRRAVAARCWPSTSLSIGSEADQNGQCSGSAMRASRNGQRMIVALKDSAIGESYCLAHDISRDATTVAGLNLAGCAASGSHVQRSAHVS